MGVPARLGGSIPGLAEWNVAKERHRLLKEIATHGVDSQYLSSSVATSLFLVRVLTSLRVSSAASRPIGVHLRAMEQFFKSLSHGWALSEEFIEAGGVRVVVGVLNRAQVDGDVHLACVRLLSLLYDADDDGGVVQRMVAELLVPLQTQMEKTKQMGEGLKRMTTRGRAGGLGLGEDEKSGGGDAPPQPPNAGPGGGRRGSSPCSSATPRPSTGRSWTRRRSRR